MSMDVWKAILPEFPIIAIILFVIAVFLRYVDKWISENSQQKNNISYERQQEIVLLIDRTLSSVKSVEAKMVDVIESNSESMKASIKTQEEMGRAIATMSQIVTDHKEMTTAMSGLLINHVREVASHPCMISAADERRTLIINKKEGEK